MFLVHLADKSTLLGGPAGGMQQINDLRYGRMAGIFVSATDDALHII